jgi:hypothetical protein
MVVNNHWHISSLTLRRYRPAYSSIVLTHLLLAIAEVLRFIL